MKNTPNKRGRPKKANAKSAAERMRAYRKRKRDAGLTSVRRWEPAAGLNPKESGELNKLINYIKEEHNIGVLLIEHDMSVVMEISDHVIVLDYGSKISDGTASFVRSDPNVIRAYLGEEEDDELPPEVASDLADELKSEDGEGA